MSGQDYGEALFEQACAEASEKIADERERLLQCIYLFVEGPSELAAIPQLLTRAGVRLQDDAIEVVDMGGVGNAPHAVRVLRSTASKDRPIILALDRDAAGYRAARHTAIASDPLVKVVFLPSTPVVTIAPGRLGGSFEDVFPLNWLVECTLGTLPTAQGSSVLCEDLIRRVDPSRPRLRQINAILREIVPGFRRVDKPRLASQLLRAEVIPESLRDLAQIVQSVRAACPIESHAEKVIRAAGG